MLATKVYFPMGPRDRGLSRKQILKQIDGSLARLQTDYVDLYQCHRYDDARRRCEETMGALTEVVEAGKARHIGFCEWPADKIQAALDMPGVAKFVSSQPQYSALWRKPEAEVIPLCEAQRDHADRLVAARPGRADRQVPAGREGAGGLARGEQGDEPLHQAVAQGRHARRPCSALRPIADEAGITLSQLALAWVLHQPNVSAVIVGATRPEQVRENVAAADVKLARATRIAAIDDALRTAAVW